MGTRPLSTRPLLAALAATAVSVGCVGGLAAAPAQAKKPAPPTPVTTTTVLPTYPTSIVGVSPQALAKSTTSGKTIRSLTMDNGKFYVGHGDYLGNSGPTKVSTFDPVTRTFAESGLTAPTEEITTFRKINGKLYAPWTDPTGSATANQGFSTNASGTWTNQFKAPAEHVFDVASLNGSDLWMVGSAKNVVGTKGGAAAYRSTDGGASWSLVAKDTSVVELGQERYYWAAALNGKMYLQAHGVTEDAPLRVFNGTSWSTVPGANPCNTVESRSVEVFKGRILCTSFGIGVVAFDGTKTTTVLPSTKWNILDFDVPGDGYIYALSRGGVYRSADGLSWTGLTTVPTYAWSIGVHNGTIYLGERLNATIRKVDGLNLASVTTTATTTTAATTTTTPCKGKSGKGC
ncbi:WD40/YVTN/BNR-like repeat-containing protein [Knoellia aerolata]|uniref:Glycosyl hydrolase n=1 Tax=Knoellia aerolata DSM 18566 TaxID=1385519 RepID=A0A0A0JYR7_9MICO|nr:hypothetical protein [Knoellia aerolata]KGN42575.1 hypothetical protein N801_15370 [Knoellia aerolata DSM 18566]